MIVDCAAYAGGRRLTDRLSLDEVADRLDDDGHAMLLVTLANFRDHSLDTVAELIVNVLKQTTPTTTASGAPGKAKYVLAEGVADSTKAAAAELLDANPLYPGLEL